MKTTLKDGSGKNDDQFPKRGDVFWVTLVPAVGTETQKTRPCVIISNNAQNKKSQRIIIAPITSNVKTVYPFEVIVDINNKRGKVMLDQIKTVDKLRLGKRLSSFTVGTMHEIDNVLKVVLALV